MKLVNGEWVPGYHLVSLLDKLTMQDVGDTRDTVMERLGKTGQTKVLIQVGNTSMFLSGPDR